MNKLLKYGLIGLATVLIAGILVWNYANKSAVDYSDEKPSATFTSVELIEKTNSDTAGVRKLIDKLIAVNGSIKKINIDSTTTTIEIGDTTSMSSIICQIDNRHQEDCKTLIEGSPISIKGKISGFTVDTDLGLGNTIQMNYCVPIKK